MLKHIGCKTETISSATLFPGFARANAQACCYAVNKDMFASLALTSLLQVVNQLDAS